jgi:hypothetical protein
MKLEGYDGGYHHPMALSALPLALFLQTSQMKSFTCTTLVNGVQDAQTAPLRSAAGLTVVLKMHSEDDHGKNTHLCETSYSLQISKAEDAAAAPINTSGTVRDLRVSADDDWDRPVTFRIDGFSQDGYRAFIFISEGRYPAWIEAMEYDMRSGSTFRDISLDRHFTRRLSSACASTLHISGTTLTGLILASSAKQGCTRTESWQLVPNKYKGGLAGGLALSEHPKRLSSNTAVTPLNVGTPINAAP